jgi:hypothetical protein
MSVPRHLSDLEESMTKVTLDISMSLDGFVAGPNRTVEQPLGDGGEGLHEWVVRLESWRERHGRTGGERNADDDVMKEAIESAGAIVMGRRMFSGGEGPWEDDPVADGWWETGRRSACRCSSSLTIRVRPSRKRVDRRTRS